MRHGYLGQSTLFDWHLLNVAMVRGWNKTTWEAQCGTCVVERALCTALPLVAWPGPHTRDLRRPKRHRHRHATDTDPPTASARLNTSGGCNSTRLQRTVRVTSGPFTAAAWALNTPENRDSLLATEPQADLPGAHLAGQHARGVSRKTLQTCDPPSLACCGSP